MAHEPAPPPAAGGPFYSRPWVLMAAGLFCAVLAWLLPFLLPAHLTPPVLRLLLLFGGGLLSLSAVNLRLRRASWDLPQRMESAALISVAGLGAWIGFLAMEEEWDSGRIFYASLFLLAAAGAVLVLLPPLARRVVLSLMVLFHFGGIVVAVTSVDPPNSTGPWLSKQLWSRVYRPYLSSMYLTNAYHFYSPDPGPPSLFWFAVHFSDGSYTWVKLPDRGNSPIGMHYQRLLALPEHTFQAIPRLPATLLELNELPADQRPERGSWEEIYHRRELGSTLKFRPKGLPIPMVQDFEVNQQYREPYDASKKFIAAVAKRVLWNTPTPGEGITAESVKAYRVVHTILTPQELASGVSPWEKTKYVPFFLGEFDRKGELKDSREPFLYWYLPIVTVPADYPNHGGQMRPGIPAVFVRFPDKSGFLLDCLEMHAAGQIKPPAEKK